MKLRERMRFAFRTPYGPVLIAYLVLRVLSFVALGVTRYPDSQSWLTLDFSGAQIRLWTVPLFFKLLPADSLREAGQATLSVVCFVGLAVVTAQYVTHSRLKPISFVVILAFGLVANVTNWDTVILGESLAISLTIGVVAAWWIFSMEPTRWTAALVCITSLLWAFLRHTHVVLTVFLALAVAVALLYDRNRRLKLIVFGTLVLTLVWGVPTLGKNAFNEEEVLITIISERVLTLPSRTAWFAEHGMPATRDVRRLAMSWDRFPYGSTAIRENKKLFRWIQAHGRSVYLEYLITHPAYLLGDPLESAAMVFTFTGRDGGALSGVIYGDVREVLPQTVEDILFGGGSQLALLFVAACVLAGAAFGLRTWTRRELVPGLAVMLSIVMYIETYHGVATEGTRHYMVAAVAIRVSLALVALLAIDRLLVRRGSLRDAAPEPS